MKFASCAVAMVTLAVAAASVVVVHGVLAQSPTSSPTPRLEPNSSLAPPSVIEQRRIRYESSIDANGQPQTRAVWEIAPVTVSQPADAETAELAAAEVQAAKEAQELVQELQAADSEGTKTELKAKLRAALARQFEAQQKQRTREISSIEERLSKLKETLQKRDAAKDKIVDRRLDQLTGVRDELAWEETQGVLPPGNNRSPNYSLNGYPPSVAPLPMGVPGISGPRGRNTSTAPSNPTTGTPMLQYPVPSPTAPTLNTPAPLAPPVPPAPATRVFPTTPGTFGTAPAPVAPPAPPAPAAAPALPATTAAPVAPAAPTPPRVPPTPVLPKGT